MENTTEARNERVTDWHPWRVWRSSEGARVFLSDDSLAWFIRRHRAKMLESGEYIPGKGARPAIVGPGFGRVVLEILRQEAGMEK